MIDDIAIEDAAPTAASTSTRSRAEADALVLELVTGHAESLLRVAHRYSACADDAQDAYQRAMELLVRHAHRLDRTRAAGWLHTVVKHEAFAVRKQRQRLVGVEEGDLDRMEERTTPSPEERVVSFERVGRAAEALARVKPDEARALWLKAAGDSYAEIGERTGWSYTKVNRCLTEGRKSFLAHYADLQAGAVCERWGPVLSAIVDGEASASTVVEARVHLRHCPGCRATLRHLRMAQSSLALVLPGAATGAGAGTGLVEPEAVGGVAGRAWDAVLSLLHERTASAAVRLQAVVETATNHKVAAVAASAAAVAGGGVAAEQAVRSERAPGARPAVVHAARVPVARPAAFSRPIVARTAASPVRSEPTAAAPRAPSSASPAARTATERAQRRRSAAAAAARRAASEPLIDPVESRAPAQDPVAQPSAASVAQAPAPARDPVAARRAAPARSSSGEFGFEGP